MQRIKEWREQTETTGDDDNEHPSTVAECVDTLY